jgi:hypothetical protein
MTAVAHGQVSPGTMIDSSSADQVKDMLPPEIYKHYKAGDYKNPVVDFPSSKWRWDDGFDEATKKNGQTIVLDENKQPVDKATGQRPEYIRASRSRTSARTIRTAATRSSGTLLRVLHGGNSHNETILNWMSKTGVQRASEQDVYFLYYDGQPRHYSPPKNPENLLFQFLAVTTSPATSRAPAALGYRYKDPNKRDLSWAYVPALRRVRAVSPANRSDGFLGSDQSQDDGPFFDGKAEDFIWKIVGHREQLRIVDPDSLAGKVQRRALPDGGWRTVAINNDRSVGYMVDGWSGVAWAPTAGALAKRKFWVIEGVPKDKYYLYGKIELWIDDQSWQGAWNRKFSWQGELLERISGHGLRDGRLQLEGALVGLDAGLPVLGKHQGRPGDRLGHERPRQRSRERPPRDAGARLLRLPAAQSFRVGGEYGTLVARADVWRGRLSRRATLGTRVVSTRRRFGRGWRGVGTLRRGSEVRRWNFA